MSDMWEKDLIEALRSLVGPEDAEGLTLGRSLTVSAFRGTAPTVS